MSKTTHTSDRSAIGQNWRNLQKQIQGSDYEKRRKRERIVQAQANGRVEGGTVNASSKRTKLSNETKSGSPAPSELPWFADDLSPEDLSLATGSRWSETQHLHSSGGNKATTFEMQRKKDIILGGKDEIVDPAKKEVGTYVAIDCEMVGVGPKGSQSVLARVSIVNWHGYVVLDRFVRPAEKVTDYRTWVSGIRPRDLHNASLFASVQSEVATLIKDRVLVGHAVHNDLKALLLSHPRSLIRDTASFPPLREIAKTKHPALRKLALLVLGIEIQRDGEEHNSADDARATMAVFRTQKAKWDQMLTMKGKLSKQSKKLT